MKSKDFKSKVLSSLSWKANKVSDTCNNLLHYRQLKKMSGARVTDIQTHMSTRELNTLYDLASELPEGAKVLEIGSYLGASSCYLSTALSPKGGHLFCVDTWENQTMPEGERDTFLEFKKNTSEVSTYIHPVRKNSQNLCKTDIQLPLDMVFIDGDHSYAGVKNDYEKMIEWIRGGGILAFHDCVHFAGVSKVIGEALASGSWQIKGHIDNLFWLQKIEVGCHEFLHPL